MFYRKGHSAALGRILQVSCLNALIGLILTADAGFAQSLSPGLSGYSDAKPSAYERRRSTFQRPRARPVSETAGLAALPQETVASTDALSALAPSARGEPLPLIDSSPPASLRVRPRSRSAARYTPPTELRMRPDVLMRSGNVSRVELPAIQPMDQLPPPHSPSMNAGMPPVPQDSGMPPLPTISEFQEGLQPPMETEVVSVPPATDVPITEEVPTYVPPASMEADAASIDASLPVTKSGGDGDSSVHFFTPTDSAPTMGDVAPAEPLSAETQDILNSLPADALPRDVTVHSELPAPGDFSVKRATEPAPIPSSVQAAQNPSGDPYMDIQVKPQSIDLNYELEKAYNALLSGDTDGAIRIYEEVLSIDPNEKTALFGLATTYHRLGLLDQARPVYGRLLKIDPYNVEALNNFFALVGAESPRAAIEQLELLAMDNPEFAPIQAQISLLNQKLGDYPRAIEYMIRATSITPENLAYKYNLAVLYDLQGDSARAATLYRHLLKLYESGLDLPASPKAIQERLTFLASN